MCVLNTCTCRLHETGLINYTNDDELNIFLHEEGSFDLQTSQNIVKIVFFSSGINVKNNHLKTKCFSSILSPLCM